MINTSSAFITLVGRPNVGKSSILNELLGQKISIVSDKPQTTRTKITGILTEAEMQLVFIDTPGLHKPRNFLGKHMVKKVADSLTDVDCCVLTVEPTPKIFAAELQLIEKFKSRNLKAILVINKIDLMKNKNTLLQVIEMYSQQFNFDAIIPVSAKTGSGIDLLLNELKKHAVPSVHYFDNDTFTDQPERVLAAEIIREKLLLLLEKEVPHGLAVEIESFKQRMDSNILDISACIYCERDSHKGIIIGKKGHLLKLVGTKARVDLESFFDCKVNLQLWVKVKENWRDREGSIHGLGLD